jgi:hypothetical protein
MNGQPRPKQGFEQGTMLDMTAGDLVFSDIPGTQENEGLVYEYRQPTVLQLREMLDHDGRARSLEQCLVAPIAGADWRLEGVDKEIAQWVDSVLRQATIDGGMATPMSDVLSQKAEAFVMRVAFHEKVWKTTQDDKVVYDKIAWRPPNTCTLLRDRDNGDLTGFTQWKFGQQNQVVIHLPYADVYVHGARRDPVRGVSDLTVTYHNYRIKEKIKYLWYTYCEVLSLPRQIVLGTTEDEVKKAVQAIAGLKNAGVAGIPASWVKEIQTIETSGTGATDFQDAIAYLDSDSALSLLAGFSELPARAMGTGSTHGPLGSYALAEASQNFFVDMLASYAEEMNAQITNSLIADLVRWNYGFNVAIPQFQLDLEEEAIQNAYSLLTALLTAPVPTNVPAEFVKELTLLVAKNMGMDVNAINAAIDQQVQVNAQNAKTAAEAGQAPLAAAADVGQTVARQAQSTLAPSSSGRPQ